MRSIYFIRKYSTFFCLLMKRSILLCFLFFSASLFAQAPLVISKKLNWAEAAIRHNPTGQQERLIWSFDGALFNARQPEFPVLMERFKVKGDGELSVSVVHAEYEPFEVANLSVEGIGTSLDIQTTIEQERNQFFGKIFFTPVIKNGNQYKRLISVQLDIQWLPKNASISRSRGPEHAFNSILRDGAIYKLAVSENGIHRISYSFLKDELNIDIDNIDPRTIQLYGNGGGVLPEPIASDRKDDLEENAILIVGEADGRFDPDDYLLFYGEGPHHWEFQKDQNIFNRITNTYDDNNYYFLKIGGSNGLRIKDQNSIASTAYTSTTFDDYIRLEEDLINLLDDFASAQGTGKDWYGDLFETIREKNYDDFSFPNIVSEEPAHIKVAFAGRSNSATSYNVKVGGQTFRENLRLSHTGDIEDRYAQVGVISEFFTPNNDNLSVAVEYPATASSKGWLDYIQINARRQLMATGEQMIFRDHQTTAFPNSTFQIANANSNTQVWDISNPTQPANQIVEIDNGTIRFGATTSELKEFISFSTNDFFPSPTSRGLIDNQNIHSIDEADLIIIYPLAFEQEAQRLASHRTTHNGYEVKTVLLDHIFNEFSSGKLDPTAIRDFAKMIHDRSNQFNYLLLLGDGSFDFKNIKNLENPSGFIPVYETAESLHPIEGFPSDDYYGLLSDNEGIRLRGALDIAVGRIPAKSKEEANIVINKLINYDTNPSTLGDWRLRQVFVADDEDSGLHQRQANQIATKVDTIYDILNVNKIFLDAYQQITTPGGQRYPTAKEAINNDIFKGALVLNYLGHGGSTGWSQERVLQINDVLSWTNFNKLPLFVTATCSFTGYDDANFVTAGEEVLLNPRGGGIGLFTTVRAVYSSSNERLTKAVFDHIYEKIDGVNPPIGELMRLGKNSNSADTTSINARKFTLIGDPSMQLALPKYEVVTEKINNKTILAGQIDTIQALQRITIEGFVAAPDGSVLTSFNGKIFPTIFDKKIEVSNLGQDASSRILPFDLQKNVLFKGTASVQNGRFQFTFVVPKDINYEYGPGKISYYAENGQEDASGSYERIMVGGTDVNAVNDTQGPLVEVFMNDSTFVFGGTTDPDPTLLVLLSDENGINVAGTSIGHDLTGLLDNDTKNTLLLNDFYESRLDDYTKGIVRYPLKDIPVGTHQVKVKAWDVFNNSSEGFTEFIVDNSVEATLERVLNYPNPFTTNTEFQFLHNLGSGQLIDVQVRIFTVSGRLVKTIDTQVLSEGNRVTGIGWDGRDDFGGQLARGVYVYKVSVLSTSTNRKTTDSDFEKLVILK